MSRKNDRQLRVEFEEQLMTEPGRDPESIKHSQCGGYIDNRTALLYVAFKRAYKDSIKFHNKNKINTTGKPVRIIGRHIVDHRYSFSDRPHMHGTLTSADTELARLAAECPGVKFSIFCLEKSEMNPIADEDLQKHIDKVSSTPLVQWKYSNKHRQMGEDVLNSLNGFNSKSQFCNKSRLIEMYCDQIDRD